MAMAFSRRPAALPRGRHLRGLPVLVHEVSRRVWGLRLRRTDRELALYIDGQRFAEHHIVSAVGVDREGQKHILGIELGATENAASVLRLLTHLRDQGLPTDRKYLFVIDRWGQSLASGDQRGVRR